MLIPIALLVDAGYYLLKRQKSMAAFTLLTAFVAAAPWVLQFLINYVSGVAVPEAVSVIAGSTWAVVSGFKMFRAGSRAKTP